MKAAEAFQSLVLTDEDHQYEQDALAEVIVAAKNRRAELGPVPAPEQPTSPTYVEEGAVSTEEDASA